MTKQDREKRQSTMLEMRDNGKTYQEIADAFFLTRQRVYDLIGDPSFGKGFRGVSEEQCIFRNLREWMNKKRITVAGFARDVYGQSGTTYKSKMRNYLRGETGLKKEAIDKILSITKMTYEECFAEE